MPSKEKRNTIYVPAYQLEGWLLAEKKMDTGMFDVPLDIQSRLSFMRDNVDQGTQVFAAKQTRETRYGNEIAEYHF